MSEHGLVARALAGVRALAPASRRRVAEPDPPPRTRTVADLVLERTVAAARAAGHSRVSGPVAEPVRPEPPISTAAAPAGSTMTPSPAPSPESESESESVSEQPPPESGWAGAGPGSAPPAEASTCAPVTAAAPVLPPVLPRRVSGGGYGPTPVRRAGPRPAAVPTLADAGPAVDLGRPVDVGRSHPTPAPRPPTPPTSAEPAPAHPTDAVIAPPWVRAALMGIEPVDPPPTAEQAAAGRALRRTFGAPRDPGPVVLAGVAQPAARIAAVPARPRLPSWLRSAVGSSDDTGRPAGAGAAVAVCLRVMRRDAGAVEGAEVTLLDGRGCTVACGVAGSDGRGRLSAPRPGAYVLVAASPGYQPAAMAVTVDPAEGPAEVDLLLVRSASVSGVVWAEGSPVPAAQLTLVQDGEVVDMLATDASGGYRLDDLADGEYALAVAASGCAPAVLVLTVPEGSDLSYDVELVAADATVAAP